MTSISVPRASLSAAPTLAVPFLVFSSWGFEVTTICDFFPDLLAAPALMHFP